MKNMSIFISFPGNDETLIPPVKRRIQTCCIESKINCDIYFAPDSNLPGDNWHDRILDEIKKTDVVIIFWSKNSHSSMGQLIEIGAAWALEKKFFAILYGTSYLTLPPMGLNPNQSISYENFLNFELFDLSNWLLGLIQIY
jgi:hypothetical protein